MADMYRLDGKIAVVMGGAGGLGEPIAKGFASRGAKCVISSRRADAIKKVADDIQKEYGADAAISFPCDATDEKSIAHLKEQVLAKYGTVDILMNALGTSIKSPADKFPVDIWNKQMALNALAVMLSCREFGPIMMAKKKGKIINMSSIRGTRVTIWGGNAGYCASKGAMDMYTKALASEWAPYNITVNAVAPTIIRTPLSESLGILSEEHLKKYLANVPLKRIGEPKDMVGLCVFLASEESDYITGQIIPLDGGLTAVG